MFHHVSISKIYFIVENNFYTYNGYVVEHIEQIRTLLRRRDVKLRVPKQACQTVNVPCHEHALIQGLSHMKVLDLPATDHHRLARPGTSEITVSSRLSSSLRGDGSEQSEGFPKIT